MHHRKIPKADVPGIALRDLSRAASPGRSKPHLIAAGAAAEMRQALGTAVFFGMIGVTFFGLIFTPVFYVIARSLARS